MIRDEVEQYLGIAWNFDSRLPAARTFRRIFPRTPRRLWTIKSSMLLNEFDEQNFISRLAWKGPLEVANNCDLFIPFFPLLTRPFALIEAALQQCLVFVELIA